MPKFTLKCEHENLTGGSPHIVTQEFDAYHIYDLIENFDLFMRGCGFVYDGVLEIVQDEVVTQNEYDDVGAEVINRMVTQLVSMGKPEEQSAVCSVCKLPTQVMMKHKCYENKCGLKQGKSI